MPARRGVWAIWVLSERFAPKPSLSPRDGDLPRPPARPPRASRSSSPHSLAAVDVRSVPPSAPDSALTAADVAHLDRRGPRHQLEDPRAPVLEIGEEVRAEVGEV